MELHFLFIFPLVLLRIASKLCMSLFSFPGGEEILLLP